jgi:Fic family protein
MGFKPTYSITNKILNNISQITGGREVIERSRIIPKWELSLQKEARLHSAHSSTAIEGNRLNLEQVKSLAEHKEVTATAKDKQEVLNYLAALDGIPAYAHEKEITVKAFLNMHKTVTQKVLQNDSDVGNFRTRQVFVGRRILEGTGIKEIVEYMPPETKDVPALVDEFLQWLNSQEVKKINPVILAGVAHYEVARIHPFIDGNGRTARLLAALILYKSGFDHRRFFALDDYYDQERSAYYAALKTVQDDNGDITRWLEYFTDGVLFSVNKVKDIVIKLGVLPEKNADQQIELSARQIKILELIRDKGKVTNKDLRQIFKISRQGILKEVSKLVEAGIIEVVSKGKGAFYKISD